MQECDLGFIQQGAAGVCLSSSLLPPCKEETHDFWRRKSFFILKYLKLKLKEKRKKKSWNEINIHWNKIKQLFQFYFFIIIIILFYFFLRIF